MEKVIISLGGSLIHPDNLDIPFLKNFKSLIEDYLKKDFKFAIFCGGGKLARDYQKAAGEIRELTDEDQDWLGIEATKINAHLVKSLFSKEEVLEKVISNPNEKIDTNKKIIICSGWKPGWSTDYDAVLLAKNIGMDTIINMSNIDYVYDSDPKKDPDAKPLKEITWTDFQKLVGNKWSPGLNMPFDPKAAKESAKNKFKVIIIGRDLENLRNVLDNQEYNGTLVK